MADPTQMTTTPPGLAPPAPLSPYAASGVMSDNKGQDTAGNYKAQDQSVESRIPGLMSTDNPIVQTAVGQSVRAANARGLQNSQMAVQSGVQAAEASVLPIASQDAGQVATQNLSAQNAAQSGALQKQATEGSIVTTNIQTQAARDNLNTQIAASNAQLVQQLGSQERVAAAQIAANKEAQGIALNAQDAMLVKQLNSALQNTILTTGSNQTIARDNLTAGQQTNLGSQASTLGSNYQSQVTAINQNTSIPDAAKVTMLNNLATDYSNNMNLLSQIYQVRLNWTTTTPDGGTTANTAGPAPAAPKVASALTPAALDAAAKAAA